MPSRLDTYFIESGIYIDFYPNNADHQHLHSHSQNMY